VVAVSREPGRGRCFACIGTGPGVFAGNQSSKSCMLGAYRAGYSQANAPLVALSLFSLSQGRLLPYWNIGPRGLIAVFSTLFHMHSQIM
jgi:hypothetical protein